MRVESLVCALRGSAVSAAPSAVEPVFPASITSTCMGSTSGGTAEAAVPAAPVDGMGLGEEGEEAQSMGSTWSAALPLTAEACLLKPDATSLTRSDEAPAATAAAAAASVGEESSTAEAVDSQADIEVEEESAAREERVWWISLLIVVGSMNDSCYDKEAVTTKKQLARLTFDFVVGIGSGSLPVGVHKQPEFR